MSKKSQNYPKLHSNVKHSHLVSNLFTILYLVSTKHFQIRYDSASFFHFMSLLNEKYLKIYKKFVCFQAFLLKIAYS